MPKRTDIKKIFLIGSGPIVIGQACEFDYSGTQACKALRDEGLEVILLNSNPATIMTDPEMADRTYIEPITPEVIEQIIKKERPDALLPTMGGQTALNMAKTVYELGVLDRYDVELIGAKFDSIMMAEDRQLFRTAMGDIGLEVPDSEIVTTMPEARLAAAKIGYPVIIRPAFTLGGTGGNVAYNAEEFEVYAKWGLEASPISQVMIEQSVIGWKEYEMEVMRDLADNVVIICSIENFDPMGVHTGDSITVAPAQTLTDKEYQIMRNASIDVIRKIGVETGGSNIQFAINPEDGRLVVIEMNPRVSRSSALASKATGFPIAKIAAKLAIGYTLDEIPNDITRETPASFEPTIDYCVVKIPRFSFEKFRKADATLTTQMKSVGEVMAIGRTFKEAFGKAVRSLENGRYWLGQKSDYIKDGQVVDKQGLLDEIRTPRWNRIYHLHEALKAGITWQELFEVTKIDPWFLHNLAEIAEFELELIWQVQKSKGRPLLDRLTAGMWRQAKSLGFPDQYLAQLLGTAEVDVRAERQRLGVVTTFKMVDTCGAEFEAKTPYFYSTYESECESVPSENKKVMILGGGPNRIGQGIEFDYCCVHAAFALNELGYETIMVNCNPETVSTDYDTSDRLYFEPLTFEDVMSIVEKEKPLGVILQFGGQTPLKLAVPLSKAGVPILGTPPDAIDRAEDRKRFTKLINKLGVRQADNGTVFSYQEALVVAARIGYPVVVRPSYVLGGQAMEIVYDEQSLEYYMTHAVEVDPERPILIDRFLENAIEVDVDAISDGERVVVGGIMEQIEQAGVHSGDSSCALPPFSIPQEIQQEIIRQTKALALELGIVGLLNIQFAIQKGQVFCIEVNPRASRTIPFVSKSIGWPLAKLATKVMVGKTLDELGFTQEVTTKHMSVKEAVYPFIKFPGVDTVLGPEMHSTGEVMGIAMDFGTAFAKSQIAAGNKLPTGGKMFLSVHDGDKRQVVGLAREFAELGFAIISTRGTAGVLADNGIACRTVNKVREGRPHIVDMIKNGDIDLMVNTTFGKAALEDSFSIRRAALMSGLSYFTTLPEAAAAIKAIRSLCRGEGFDVKPIQEYYR